MCRTQLGGPHSRAMTVCAYELMDLPRPVLRVPGVVFHGQEDDAFDEGDDAGDEGPAEQQIEYPPPVAEIEAVYAEPAQEQREQARRDLVLARTRAGRRPRTLRRAALRTGIRLVADLLCADPAKHHSHDSPLDRGMLLSTEAACKSFGFQARANSRTSTRRPAIAAAAAMAGDIRWVRPPLPWRPSKLRLEVEAQRSPGLSRSAFIARHIEQPGSRHSNPAARKISSRPSSSACSFTSPEPGTTMAPTWAATLRPLAIDAASRKSSMRALVQEPMKTRSTRMEESFVPGVKSI